MKIGLLLGSFDPPHIGHLWAAHYALLNGMDNVFVVPAWRNPWKTNQTPYNNRFEMCKLMFNTDNRITVCDLDKTIKSNYTYEGLEKLLEMSELTNNDFYIIGGTDIAQQVPKWKHGDWILKHFSVMEVPRLGYTNASIGIECSSTAVKQLLSEGKSPIPFITKELQDYIITKNLFIC